MSANTTEPDEVTEEMFTMKLGVLSLESVMQATDWDINAIHHTIDSCRTTDSNSQAEERSVSP